MVLSLIGAFFMTRVLAFGANRGNESVDHTVIFDFRPFNRSRGEGGVRGRVKIEYLPWQKSGIGVCQGYVLLLFFKKENPVECRCR